MLSIGIRLSLDDFALAFKRFFPFPLNSFLDMPSLEFIFCSFTAYLFQTFTLIYRVYCTIRS